MADERVQVNVRVTEEYAQMIDRRRMELQSVLGHIPTRSEIVRMALDAFLGEGRASRKK